MEGCGRKLTWGLRVRNRGLSFGECDKTCGLKYRTTLDIHPTLLILLTALFSAGPPLRIYYMNEQHRPKNALWFRNRTTHRFIIVEGGFNRRGERSDVIIVAECAAVARTLRVVATCAVHEVHFLEVTREYSRV